MQEVIVVDGLIGAGKTELVKALAERMAGDGLKVVTILEPVDEWSRIGILAKFYQSPPRWGYSFQSFVYTSRVRAIMRAVQTTPDADVYLLERSPLTDRIFMAVSEGSLDPVEKAAYLEWADLHDLLLPFRLADATSFCLRTSLPTCMSRLTSRARDGEIAGASSGGVSITYQERLRHAHEVFFGLAVDTRGEFTLLPRCPYRNQMVLGPDIADRNFRDPGPDRDYILSEILRRWRLRRVPTLVESAEIVTAD